MDRREGLSKFEKNGFLFFCKNSGISKKLKVSTLDIRIKQIKLSHPKVPSSELKTFEWDILNPDRIINLEIKNERRTSNI